MRITRRQTLALPLAGAALAQQGASRSFVRFETGGRRAYGLLEGERIVEIEGLFRPERRKAEHELKSVKLLYPCEPRKVFAVGLNYKSHLGDRPAPKQPEIFYKPLTCLQNPGDPIVIPADAKNCHYEAELVIVIGKRVRNASRAEAQAAIFGYTCGNDVSERDWQRGDLQWWRAKGSDTFGPLGPVIVQGFEPEKGSITMRLNGQVKQQQKLSDLLFDGPACVEFISRYVTLEPGDLVYTGTPGSTSAMKQGDVAEVEIPGIGVLRNPVKQA